ncbi:hypothetical protein G6O67_002847 [Ophiocordyceps sinensis]|uniref:Uncharacterized protein n=1 Tax=Ophiocordyceps sinensis TaxID=72228 RepID=A0A8H4V7N8_9HYPO|nr:hypothetical protein G6O67_002847 [Ophiocordyceps sinensis]
MVHFTFTVLAVSMSALAATVHNRRGMEVRAEPGMPGTAVPIMSPQKRDDAKVDDAKVQGTRDAIKNLEQETDGVPEEAKKSATEAKDQFNKVLKEAKEKLDKDMEEAKKKIPDEKKKGIEDKKTDVQNRFNELSPDETREVLKGLNKEAVEKKAKGKAEGESKG